MRSAHGARNSRPPSCVARGSTPRVSQLPNATRVKASAREIGQSQQIAAQPATTVYPRLRPEKLTAIRGKILCHFLQSVIEPVAPLAAKVERLAI
jgi:hypothetical protein